MSKEEIARKFGFNLRRVRDGWFINAGGDDLMKISDDGEVIVYEIDANAFYAASLISCATEMAQDV